LPLSSLASSYPTTVQSLMLDRLFSSSPDAAVQLQLLHLYDNALETKAFEESEVPRFAGRRMWKALMKTSNRF
jgi:hypothetical protein